MGVGDFENTLSRVSQRAWGRLVGKIQPEKGVLGTCFPPAPGYFHKKELLLAHYVGKKIGKHIQNCAFLNKNDWQQSID